MLEISLQKSSERGITYLQKVQDKNGCFTSFSSPDTNFKSRIQYKTIFSTALIMQSLTNLTHSKNTDGIIKSSVKFLLSQKSSSWTWNYWDRQSPEAKTMAYPDDLDDTFCTLSALYLFDQKLITGEALAHIVKILTLVETQEGGPYKTWLVSNTAPGIWKDVDVCVNANIAFFLQMQDIKLPKLSKLFTEIINNKIFTTPYYPNHFATFYFLSRVLKGSSRKKLQKIVLQMSAVTSLDIALKTISLLNLGASSSTVSRLIAELVMLQRIDGSWPAAAFYTGVNPQKDKVYVAGSEALTTAFCLEAYALYNKKIKENIVVHQNKKKNAIHNQVVSIVKKRILLLGPNLQKRGLSYLEKALKKDRMMQITLLPYYFYQSLSDKKEISKNILVQLGAASLYGWIAYTIYDDFLDNEPDIPSLPLANICLRELTIIFNSILKEEIGFQKVFQSVMDRLEEVNTWEVTHCRFNSATNLSSLSLPNYGSYQVLADRSMGHALGCVALILLSNKNQYANDVASLFNFFSHYLIARQINDDAHDWESDLKKGHINSVAALLLQRTTTNLQQTFWNETIEDVCDLIELHVYQARLALSSIDIVTNKEILEQFIDEQEHAVITARKEKQRALSFLNTYITNQ